jgi:diguanylate cyclase (GGDEF)-like protein
MFDQKNDNRSTPISKRFIRSMNITTIRYFFIIFLFIGSILAGTIGVLYNFESKDYLERKELEEQLNLNLLIGLVANNFETIVSDIVFLSKQNELQHMINADDQTYISWISNEYLEFCRGKGLYDQIRFLDQTGREVVRVNYNGGEPEIVDQSVLQSKGDRYYFKDTFALGENEIFVSPLDLNIEKGKIETPLKPMIRFGVPVFDGANMKRGVIILNYLGDKLIKSIKDAARLSTGEIMLVNSDGYWLYSPVKNDEWGFMIKERSDRKFSIDFPQAWNEIRSSDNCQIYNANGLFTSATVYPLTAGLKSSSGSAAAFGDSGKNITISEYYWKIISHIPEKDLKKGTQRLLVKLFLMAILLFLLAAIPSWIISKAIVRRKMHQMELYHSANYDKLTNLPNRSLFYDRLTQVVGQSKRYNRKFALMFIDLDGFKSVNDTLGHDAGDELLIETAKKLIGCVRNSDTVARMGGDEFTIILSSISTPENAEIVARKIIQVLSSPFKIKGHDLQIGASIGISLYPENGDDIDTLLKKADQAMYQAKKNGKNDYRFSM